MGDRQAEKQNRNADKKTVETTQELIALYKREFGDSWRDVFSATVEVKVSADS